jgi:hypothetical protein
MPLPMFPKRPKKHVPFTRDEVQRAPTTPGVFRLYEQAKNGNPDQAVTRLRFYGSHNNLRGRLQSLLNNPQVNAITAMDVITGANKRGAPMTDRERQRILARQKDRHGPAHGAEEI